MDISNLAKVFGPTIVAHAVPDPDPMTLLQDTKRQPKVGQTLVFLSSISNCCMISVISDSQVSLQVVERLLMLPMDYWSQLMMVEQENIDPAHVIENTNAYSTPRTPEVQGNPGFCSVTKSNNPQSKQPERLSEPASFLEGGERKAECARKCQICLVLLTDARECLMFPAWQRKLQLFSHCAALFWQ